MSVGTDPLACYQGEDVAWEFTLTDGTGNITTIAGYVIELVIKETAADLDPPLIGPVTCSISSASSPMKFLAQVAVDLDPGTYVVSIRRATVKTWQFVHAPLTVTDSASED
jgi:hypothetical protein